MSGLPRRVWTVAGVLAAAIGTAVSPARAATTEVVAGGMRFTPARVQIALGDSVVWEAADDGHTVTSRNGSFDSSPRGLMGEGDKYRFRFRVPGTFAYFCRVHQGRGMRGEIVVVDPSAPTATTSRVTPVTAAATTSSTTTTTAPTTTTTRRLATSSTTSRSIATATTAPTGTPAAPQAPPTLNPNTPVVGSAAASSEDLPGARAAGAASEGTGTGAAMAIGVGLLAALAVAGGTIFFRVRRRPSH